MSTHTIVFCNVNTDRRISKGGVYRTAYPELAFEARAPELFRRLHESAGGTGILALCEVLPQDLETAVALCREPVGTKIRKDLRMDVLTAQYCPDGGAFHYVLAFPSELYDVQLMDHVYVTVSGRGLLPAKRALMAEAKELTVHNYGQEFEKSMPVYLVTDRTTGARFALGIVHVGLRNRHREAASRIIEEFAKDMWLLDVPFIAGGDWNTFDDCIPTPAYCQAQFKALSPAYWSTTDLVAAGVTSTFHAFPYDCARFMRADQRAREKELLAAGEDGVDALRALHQEVADGARVEEGVVGVDGLFEHRIGGSILDGPIMDMVLVWEAEERPAHARAHVVRTEGTSDHDGIALSVVV